MISNVIIDSLENFFDIHFSLFGNYCTMILFFAWSTNLHDVNFLHHLCVNCFVSALQLTQFINLYFCFIIPLVLLVKTIPKNNPMESIYTRIIYFFYVISDHIKDYNIVNLLTPSSTKN